MNLCNEKAGYQSQGNHSTNTAKFPDISLNRYVTLLLNLRLHAHATLLNDGVAPNKTSAITVSPDKIFSFDVWLIFCHFPGSSQIP